MTDLFDHPIIPGLSTYDDIVSPDEERFLIAAIDATEPSPFRFRGWTGKRLTTSFGWIYDFDTGRVNRAAPFPEWLTPFRDRAAKLVGLSGDELIQALLTRYDPGAGIGWHRDRPAFEHVVGISLGAPATMRFRRRNGLRFRRATMPLPARGGYRMSGEARTDWEHSILEVEQPRWSVTFRTMRSLTPKPLTKLPSHPDEG